MNSNSKRIQTLINIIPQSEVIADIGCDHGAVAVALIIEKKARKVIASDISIKCLEKARILAEKNKCEKAMEFVVSDGFNNINASEINTAVIAGMGGREIVSILSKFLPENLVLQPMRNLVEVREFLIRNGYDIITDFIMIDKKKPYNYIIAKKGEQKELTELEIIFGKTNLENPTCDFIDYLNDEKRKTREILKTKKVQSKQIYLQNLENALNLVSTRSRND